MLETLQIDNIALIEKLEISFYKGLNILSGETGAGKSIIIDSLNFVLGTRADKSLISYGKDTAKVSAFFNISDSPNAKILLEDMEIDCDGDELVLQRVMTDAGKNTCRINGQKVTLAMLKEVAASLTDIYGQHEATGLLDDENHIVILDKYAKSALVAPLEKQRSLHEEYTRIKKELSRYGSLSDVAKKTDMLRFELDEIEKADLKDGEEEELLATRKKMNNSRFITDALAAAENALNGDYDGSALTTISEAKSQLSSVDEYDSRYGELIDRLDSAKIEIKDIAETVKDLLGESEYNPYEAERVEQRLALVRTLKRKYGNGISEILAYAEKIREELSFYDDAEFNIEKLTAELSKCEKSLSANAENIHKIRLDYAEKLADNITAQLKELGMNNATFFADVEYDSSNIGPEGADSVLFMFSANAGQPAKALSKVISGGELSRFMLAVKNIISDVDGIQTMVFDEIDTGISGKIAQVVAEKLYNISKDKQVLAVTHLPQLASMADAHYLISKSTDGNKTFTNVELLNRKGTLQEIARLLGGSEYGTHALPHAEEMKDFADKYKKG